MAPPNYELVKINLIILLFNSRQRKFGGGGGGWLRSARQNGDHNDRINARISVARIHDRIYSTTTRLYRPVVAFFSTGPEYFRPRKKKKKTRRSRARIVHRFFANAAALLTLVASAIASRLSIERISATTGPSRFVTRETLRLRILAPVQGQLTQPRRVLSSIRKYTPRGAVRVRARCDSNG